MAEPIIEVNNVTMEFNMSSLKVDSLKEYFIRLVKHELYFKSFLALEDVSFTVERGDVMGLIGLNGSGKSTMLKIISGIMKPTKGSAVARGTISPLIELGAGFDLDLTARENIYLNGSILGHDKKYMDSVFDDIVEFSELQDFLDIPIKNYSSGMQARLGFAIATVVKPDILIVDEVLAVGDFKFQEKCEARIRALMAGGTTVLIVSHSIALIETLCNKVVWLDHGHVVKQGEARAICEEYNRG